ncbi:hypothetical protein V8F20_010233 [Naviculisporaceae sp. PSN 640]
MSGAIRLIFLGICYGCELPVMAASFNLNAWIWQQISAPWLWWMTFLVLVEPHTSSRMGCIAEYRNYSPIIKRSLCHSRQCVLSCVLAFAFGFISHPWLNGQMGTLRGMKGNQDAQLFQGNRTLTPVYMSGYNPQIAKLTVTLI